MTKQKNSSSSMMAIAAAMALSGVAAVAPARAQQGYNNSGDNGSSPVLVQGDRGSGGYRDGVTATTSNGNLQATLTTDRSQYAPGRAADLRLSLTNLTARRFDIAANNVREYDITVRDDKTNRVVWQWSATRPARPAPLQILLGPNETRTNREYWDLRDNRGAPVPSGVYVVEATIYPLQMARAKIFVQDRGQGGGTRPDGYVEDLPRPGANGGGSNKGGGVAPNDNARISATLSATSASGNGTKAGNTVNFTFTITNQGAATRAYRFRSGQQFEIEARPLSGSRIGGARQAVWSLSRDRMFTDAFTTISLAPRQTRTFTGAWTVGNNVPSGDYEIRAYLTPVQDDSAAKATLTLRVTGNGSAPLSSKQDAQQANDAPNLSVRVVNGPRPQVPTSLNPPSNLSNAGVPGNGVRGESVLPNPVSANLRDIADKSAAWSGRRVTVSGIYKGWKGGSGAPPVRRSDWVIEQSGVSLYVTGRAPQVRAGDAVQITGTVKRTADGRAYIELE